VRARPARDADDVLFEAISALVTFGGLGAAGTWLYRRADDFTRHTFAAPCPLDAVPEGSEVWVRGVVVPTAPVIRAPLTGRACVFYEVTGEQYVAGAGWQRSHHEVGGEPFALDDGTGVAAVDAAGAQLELTARAVHGWAGDHANPIRTREAIIAPGSKLLVIGRAVREPDPEGASRADGYRSAPPTRLRFACSPRAPLYVSDRRDV
jgi:hypothetical protein